jgi:hypothetical protein
MVRFSVLSEADAARYAGDGVPDALARAYRYASHFGTLRAERGWSLAEVAGRTGLRAEAIEATEAGERVLTADEFLALATLYGYRL